MNILFALIFIIIPTIVNAGNMEPPGFIYILGFLLLLAIFLISWFISYLKRHDCYPLFLYIDIIFGISYIFILHFLFPNYRGEILSEFFMYPIVAIFLILGIIFFVKKHRGENILPLKKVFLHTIITFVIAVLFRIIYGV